MDQDQQIYELDCKIKDFREVIELLIDHHKDCECWCMDHRAIGKSVLEKPSSNTVSQGGD